MIKTAEVQVLTLVGHQTQLRCWLMILLEQQHIVFCLGGRMQSTVQCKDSDQCLLDGEVAVHAEHCQKPWIGLGIREYVKTLFHILLYPG